VFLGFIYAHIPDYSIKTSSKTVINFEDLVIGS